MTAPVGAAERLRRLRLRLRESAILRADAPADIVGRDGSSVPWMLYTPALSLTADGMQLAAGCLLDRLASFESTQLASFGYTAVPLMAGCVAAGEGRYSGLVIRHARKEHGARRRVEGPADRSRPVVVIDDSLSAGTSFRQAAQALEEDGFDVEGTVALVHFPFRGGAEWARGVGYRVDTLFDVWDDLEMPLPVHTPGYLRVPVSWAADGVPDDLHPAEVARLVAEHFLRTGWALRPPHRLSDNPRGAEDTGAGGVYVSFRDRRTDDRLGRDGFWHFDPSDAVPVRDLVLATVKTVRSSGGAISLERLPYLKIGVSFLGRLRPAQPAEADFDRYGVVVRSRYWPTKVGGALPNTQVFTSELEQLTHARRTNAGISLFEPHDLWIHDIDKRVEPGTTWSPYGADEGAAAAWRDDDAVGAALTRRAWVLLRSLQGGDSSDTRALPEDLIPAPIAAVAVTLYDHGPVGCGVAWRTSTLDSALMAATRGALQDRRYRPEGGGAALNSQTLVVSVLHDREWLADASIAKVARKMRTGLDSISVHQGTRQAVFLDSVVTYFNWDKEYAARQLLRKAGITAGSPTWFTYRTTCWAGPDDVYRLISGFSRPTRFDASDEALRKLLESTAGHIHDGIGADGMPCYRLEPATATEIRTGTVARLVHALAAMGAAADELNRPKWEVASAVGLRRCLDAVSFGESGARVAPAGQQASSMGDLALLEAVATVADQELRAHRAFTPLGVSLRRLVQPDGRIADVTAQPVRHLQDHDYLPGVALSALAKAFLATKDDAFLLDWVGPYKFYRRRWTSVHPWGLLAWHLQAWSTIHQIDPRDEYADFVFELADWAIERQLRKNGAFLTDMATVPSFHTAFVAEGIADAWLLANRLTDHRRALRYAASWQAAINYSRRLVIGPRDTFALKAGHRAIGAVRGTEGSSECRVDYGSHLVMALVKGFCAQRG